MLGFIPPAAAPLAQDQPGIAAFLEKTLAFTLESEGLKEIWGQMNATLSFETTQPTTGEVDIEGTITYPGVLEFSLDAEGDVKIVGESYGALVYPITPTLQSSAINIIDGQLNSGLNFSLYAESKKRVGNFTGAVEYTANSAGKVIIAGVANNLLSFSSDDIEGDVIVIGDAVPAGTITFGVAASAEAIVAATSQSVANPNSVTTEITASATGGVIVKGVGDVTVNFTTHDILFGQPDGSEGDVIVSDTGSASSIGFTLDGEGGVIITGAAAGTFNITNEFVGRHVYPQFPEANNVISFTVASTGLLSNRGRLNLSYSFDFSGRLAQFSDGEGAGTIGFTFKGKGVNVTEHIYSRDGVNGLSFIGNGYNGVIINQPDNGVKLLANGTTDVKLLR